MKRGDREEEAARGSRGLKKLDGEVDAPSLTKSEREASERASRLFLSEKKSKIWPRFLLLLRSFCFPLKNARLDFLLCGSPGATGDAACALAGREHHSRLSFAFSERAITGSVVVVVDRNSFSLSVVRALAAPRPSFFHGRCRG